MRRLVFLACLGLWLTGSARAQLEPLPYVAKQAVPALTKSTLVKFTTDKGTFTLAVYPQAAPNAARRFLELVEAGFYNNTPIFRVVPEFVAQFGINWRGDYPKWKENNFHDDPSLFKLDEGTIAFAKAGPNTNSTQVFINYGDNSRLASNGNFTTFGKVVEGMDVVRSFPSVGDPRMGLDQDRMWADGDAYLGSLNAKPAMITRVEVVKPQGKPEAEPKP